MSLRMQVVTIIVGLTVAMVVFLYAVPHRIMVHGFADLERAQVLDDLGRARGALDRETDRLQATARDWGWWDEARDYVLGRTPDWIDGNLDTGTIAALDVSVLALCNLRGEIVGGAARDCGTGQKVALPRTMIGDCLRAGARRGFATDRGAPYLVATETIRGTDAGTAPVGTLVVARVLDQHLQAALAKALRQPFEVHALATGPGALGETTPVVRIQGTDLVSGTTTLADVRGRPSLRLEVSRAREVAARGQRGATAFMASVVSIGLVFGLATLLLIETRVVSRVCRLTECVRQMQISRRPGRLPAGGRDELSALATSANLMLDALERSQRELLMIQFAVDQAGESVFLIDAEGRIIYASDVACRALGYERDEVRLMPVEQVDPSLGRRPWSETLAAVEASGPIPWVSRHVLRDGTQRPVETSLAAAEHHGQRLCVAVVRDISARQEAEYAQRLEAVAQLAAGVAHEFNNLLAGIVLSAEGVLRQTRELETRRLVETIMRAGHRGAGICRSLTAMARPRSDACQPVRLEETVQAALDLSAPALRDGDVCLTRQFGGAGRLVMAEPGELEQVFMNLVINATHAMSEGGELTVSVDWEPAPEPHGCMLVSVMDTGCGISEDDLPHVFEPFFTTKGRLAGSDVPGTGLGLSVSHGIIAALGGSIGVRTRLGRGTTFEVRIPVAADPIQTDQSTAWLTLAVTPDVGALRVLLAEDEPDLGVVMAEGLEAGGHQVTHVSDAREAMDMLASDEWDVVVSDLMMPGGGGRAVLAAALETPSPPAVVVVTGRGDTEVLTEIVSAGAAACLQKPFSLGDLLRVVQEAALPV